jgi:hypothetical protein
LSPPLPERRTLYTVTPAAAAARPAVSSAWMRDGRLPAIRVATAFSTTAFTNRSCTAQGTFPNTGPPASRPRPLISAKAARGPAQKAPAHGGRSRSVRGNAQNAPGSCPEAEALFGHVKGTVATNSHAGREHEPRDHGLGRMPCTDTHDGARAGGRPPRRRAHLERVQLYERLTRSRGVGRSEIRFRASGAVFGDIPNAGPIHACHPRHQEIGRISAPTSAEGPLPGPHPVRSGEALDGGYDRRFGTTRVTGR